MSAIFKNDNIRTINTTNIDSISDNEDYIGHKIILSHNQIYNSIPHTATDKQDKSYQKYKLNIGGVFLI